jgi:hypothetical protein
MYRKTILLFIALLLLSGCAGILKKGPDYQIKKEQKLIQKATERVRKCIKENVSTNYHGPIPAHSKIDSIIIDPDSLILNIHLSKHFSYQSVRPENIKPTYALFKKYLGRKFRNFKVTIFSLNEPVETLVANFFRQDTSDFDTKRLPKISKRLEPPLIQNLHKKPWQPNKGLFNRNVALWHSHGFYYSLEKDRWEWQRPRLFSTVEDLLPMSFTIPYLVPMLENAGANVFIPRERSLQTNEIVIDNDSSSAFIGTGEYREFNSQHWQQGGIGFGIGSPPYPANVNPFLQGSYRFCQSKKINSAFIEWIPDIPETGRYGVYISYSHSSENVPDARYTIFHCGGITNFLVNQQIGGETWLYLGEFKFEKGMNSNTGKVLLTNKSRFPGKIVTADAVRFGGGMGNILRNGRVSGYPRFAEGARYYLQYAGMPDTLVYNLHKDTTDYKDDYQSRGEFVNYLKGKPFGPNKDRATEGLGIPIDLSLSFHTDAGTDTNDNTIGTLMIYAIEGADSQAVFPDGMARLANRDFGDILQTQLVNDIRSKYRPDWNRRALMNADYSEAFRPNVPACLLELLSHQNFGDMTYALSPHFRFDISRSIYKGMLKFIATQNLYNYIVQPLPVSHFYAYFSDSAEVTLGWQPVNDPIEPTAFPEKYVIYTQIEDTDFDNGTLVDTSKFVYKKLDEGVIFSFKVSAVNEGGESFPSEVLSVCWIDSCKKPVLIINGFDRVSAPEIVKQPPFKGFADFLDPGVADKYDFNFTGSQFDFDMHSKWRTNDAPGHGASQANFETQIRIGNTFNYPFIHGSAIKNCGYSFVSVSDEAVMDNLVNMNNYHIVDLILGEEKRHSYPEISTDHSSSIKINRNYRVFPSELQLKIKEYFDNGGNLFMSGAYVGTDIVGGKRIQVEDVAFVKNELKFVWQTDHAAVNGDVFCIDSLFLTPFEKFSFNSEVRSDIYTVESPDAIDPVAGAKTILRYSENRFSAAIAYFGEYSVIVFGFPFETIVGEDSRNSVMKAVISNFEVHSK